MDRNELYDKWLDAIEKLGGEDVMLQELFDAMSTAEVEDNLSHIDRHWELNLFENEEE